MGDLGLDTAVSGGGGRYTAVLSRDWEIWGPNGGYLAAILLRAAGAHSGLPRPASLAVHFLGGARFDEVQLTTETVRAGRRSESIRVSMTQDGTPDQPGKPIAEAMVWTVSDDAAGPEFDWTAMPDVPKPDDLRPLDDLLAEENLPTFTFWTNLELRPVAWLPQAEFDKARPLEPRLQAWFRFRPAASFDDPFADAARVALLLDTEGWPAAAHALEPGDAGQWMAPNMDLHVAFHQSPNQGEWLLCDIAAPLSSGGLVGASGTVWGPDGRLLGTGIQQMLMRNVSPVPPPLASG